MSVFICLIIPFIGTSLGAALVFLMKNKINNKLEKILLGFASGVMVAASFFFIIIAINKNGRRCKYYFLATS